MIVFHFYLIIPIHLHELTEETLKISYALRYGNI